MAPDDLTTGSVERLRAKLLQGCTTPEERADVESLCDMARSYSELCQREREERRRTFLSPPHKT